MKTSDTQNKKIIYESPDNGHTVYARVVGESQRVLHTQSDHAVSLQKNIKNSQLWYDIGQAAEKDPVLQNMLDRVVVYYELTNQTQ